MITINLHHDLTVDDLESLPEELRYELHEGSLLIMSPAVAWHSEVIWRVTACLRAAGMTAIPEVGIEFSKQDTRNPDVAVFREPPDLSKAYFPPSDFLIVVEVVSPSSEDFDRILKPVQYARAAIPEYWRVENDPEDKTGAIVHQHKLVDGKYTETSVVKLSDLERSP